jgi:hypothetical protein
MLSFLVALACLSAVASAQNDKHPHLASAWVAESTGDGEPGQTGKESYLYEDCPKGVTSDTCVQAHIWDYPQQPCTKYQVNRGFKSRFSGTFYVQCDATECCTDGQGIPDLKKWDIGQVKGPWKDDITYLGKKETTALNNETVLADNWHEEFPLPFTKLKVKYDYFITTNGSDVITHRINFDSGTNGSIGAILYGDFQVQHDIPTFRGAFEPPADCLKANVMTCPSAKVEEWNRKYFN